MMHVQDYDKLKTQGRSAQEIYDIIRADALKLGGAPGDTAQRAIVYHHIYVSSGGNFLFPLIAGHGALWARWYLVLAHIAAHFLAIIDITDKQSRRAKMRGFNDYVDAFKTINRSVMMEVYISFHFTKLFQGHEITTNSMPPRLVDYFARCHEMAKNGTQMSLEDQRQFYKDYFRWEQGAVVVPLITKAVAAFNWPLAEWFCMRPWVWFSYFKVGKALVFKNFVDAEERLKMGLIAFDRGAVKGWPAIEAALTQNPFFPREFSADANTYFKGLTSENCSG